MTDSQRALAGHNLRVYESKSVVGGYFDQEKLFPAEAALLARIAAGLPEMRMLDIGIGGGRTTLHFAERAKEYIGIDYSAAMVQACHTRFPSPPASVSFRVGDVRDLSAFPDGAFDLVLFSYNGLDYIPHEDRLAGLAEMRRVTKPGGYLCFSSHNLVGLGRGPGHGAPHAFGSFSLRRLLIRALIFACNGSLAALRAGDHAVVRDDGCGFRLRTYYVRPSEQLRRLTDLGLGQVEIYGSDGLAIEASVSDDVSDEWLYYLAKTPIP